MCHINPAGGALRWTWFLGRDVVIALSPWRQCVWVWWRPSQQIPSRHWMGLPLLLLIVPTIVLFITVAAGKSLGLQEARLESAPSWKEWGAYCFFLT